MLAQEGGLVRGTPRSQELLHRLGIRQRAYFNRRHCGQKRRLALGSPEHG
jgi:hypothetical protein